MIEGNQGSRSVAKQKRLGVRTPAKAFSSCPYCERQDIFKFDGQVFCNHCGWNSLSAHCEAIDLAHSYRDASPTRPVPPIKVLPRIQENIKTALGELSIA